MQCVFIMHFSQDPDLLLLNKHYNNLSEGKSTRDPIFESSIKGQFKGLKADVDHAEH